MWSAFGSQGFHHRAPDGGMIGRRFKPCVLDSGACKVRTYSREKPADSKIAISPAIRSHWTKIPAGLIHSFISSHSSPAAPAVVLVHGLVISSRYMIPTAEQLVPFCRIYAPDLPGYGRSCKPKRTLTLPQLADALDDWMMALGLVKAHLIANSFGCQILVEFALRHRDRVNRLVLQGPTVDPGARSLRRQFLRLVVNSRREQRSLARITFADYRAAGPRRAWETVKMALADRIEEKLPHVQAPTLVVRGENDPVVPQDWAERVARLLPRGELCIIQDAAHTLNYSAPEKFAAAIRPFLQLAES